MPKTKVGEFDIELGEEFFKSFSNTLLCNLHIELRYGDNLHHVIEAVFKAVGRALDKASQIDRGRAMCHRPRASCKQTPMIVIVDYGMGNLRSVDKAFLSQGINAFVTRDPDGISRADGLVLPGVGAFGDCMKNLAEYGWWIP